MILYLCNGEKKCNKSKGCYKNGGECRHTAIEANALNKPVVPPIKDPLRYEVKQQQSGKFVNTIFIEREVAKKTER